jgi:hypothetical protein
MAGAGEGYGSARDADAAVGDKGVAAQILGETMEATIAPKPSLSTTSKLYFIQRFLIGLCLDCKHIPECLPASDIAAVGKG